MEVCRQPSLHLGEQDDPHRTADSLLELSDGVVCLSQRQGHADRPAQVEPATFGKADKPGEVLGFGTIGPDDGLTSEAGS